MLCPVCELTNVQSDRAAKTKIVGIVKVSNGSIDSQCIDEGLIVRELFLILNIALVDN